MKLALFILLVVTVLLGKDARGFRATVEAWELVAHSNKLSE